MQFTTRTQTLRQALTAVTAVIPSKPTIQILNNILVEADQDVLTLTACNTEQTVTMRVRLTEPTDNHVKFLVNARDIKAIVAAANFDTIVFDLDTADADTADVAASMLNIGCGFSDFTLPTLPPDDYPTESEKQEPTATLTLQSNDLRLALSRVGHAIGTDDLRPQIKGVFIDVTENSFTAVATDTRLLAKTSLPYTAEQATSAILPSSALPTLQGAFLSEPTVVLTLYPNEAVFHCGDNTFSTVLVKGNFPAYGRVIPQTHQYEAKFNRKELIAAVNSAATLADTVGLARLSLTPSQCVVSVSNLDFQQKATSKCKCDFNGSEMTIRFNIRYLQSVLKSIDTEEVALQMTDNTRPGVFVGVGDDNTLNLLMPMAGQ